MHWQELKNNPRLRQNLEQRAQILQAIRQFFWQEGFLEMETPLLVKDPNLETYLESFETILGNEKGQQFPAYLITSPEYALKKLLAVGFAKIFQLSKVFRNNEPWSRGHNPEFTMLEWYETGISYHSLMSQTEKMICFLVKKLNSLKSLNIKYQDREIDLATPWPRLSMKEAWQKYAGVNLDEFLTCGKMTELARKKGYHVSNEDNFDDLFFKIFLSEIEPKIAAENRPVFLYDYPAPMAALARIKKDDSRYAERFELYLGGWELANGYSELTDWQEQEKRFWQVQESRRQLGKKVYNKDKDFIAVLKSGLPECAGVALGVDRLVMVLIGAKDINEVMSFSARELFENY